MAEVHPLTIDQGSVFEVTFGYADQAGAAIDVTGYTARMHIRPTPQGALLFALESGDEITINGPAGEFALRLDATETAALAHGRYRYDLEILPGGVEAEAIRLIEGPLTVTPEVTHA